MICRPLLFFALLILLQPALSVSENHSPISSNFVAVAIGVIFFVSSITTIIYCTCCKDYLSPKPQTLDVSRHDTYQENLDSPGTPLDGPIIIEPLPDITKGRNMNNNIIESQFKARPRPMDFNYVINRGLINDQFDWSATQKNMARKQMKYIKEIGSGWFGQVIEGELSKKAAQEIQVDETDEQNNKVAVQILNGDMTSIEKAYVLYSARKFKGCHKNVVRLLAMCTDTQPYLLIYQYFGQRSDLKHHLIKNRANCDAFLDSNFLLMYALHIADGLAFLHERNFVLSDLACRTCFVTKYNVVKIGDYGVHVALYPNDYYTANGPAIPLRWCAPETLVVEDSTNLNAAINVSISSKEVDKRANIWSLGVTFWEILEFAKMPYLSASNEDVIENVIRSKRETLSEPLVPMRLRDKCYNLICLCTNYDPAARPSIQKVVDLLMYIDSNYRNVMLNKSLDLDFEKKWAKLTKTPNAEPKIDSPVTLLQPVQSPVNYNLPKVPLNVDENLERIDKRNFILTLSDEELSKLTEEQLTSFFEYLSQNDIDNLQNRYKSVVATNNSDFLNGDNVVVSHDLVESLDFGVVTRDHLISLFDALERQKNLTLVRVLKQRIFGFIDRQIDQHGNADDQWQLINKFVDFLDLKDSELVRQKFESCVQKGEEKNKTRSFESERMNAVATPPFVNPNKESTRVDDQNVSLNGSEKKTSTPWLSDKNSHLPKPNVPPILPSMSNGQLTPKEDRPQVLQEVLQHEEARRQISAMSDDVLSKMSIEELEQQYFSFMSSDEIFGILAHKRNLGSKESSSSLSSSFFKRPVPTASSNSTECEIEWSADDSRKSEKSTFESPLTLPQVSYSEQNGQNKTTDFEKPKPDVKDYFRLTPNMSSATSNDQKTTSSNVTDVENRYDFVAADISGHLSFDTSSPFEPIDALSGLSNSDVSEHNDVIKLSNLHNGQ